MLLVLAAQAKAQNKWDMGDIEYFYEACEARVGYIANDHTRLKVCNCLLNKMMVAFKSLDEADKNGSEDEFKDWVTECEVEVANPPKSKPFYSKPTLTTLIFVAEEYAYQLCECAQKTPPHMTGKCRDKILGYRDAFYQTLSPEERLACAEAHEKILKGCPTRPVQPVPEMPKGSDFFGDDME